MKQTNCCFADLTQWQRRKELSWWMLSTKMIVITEKNHPWFEWLALKSARNICPASEPLNLCDTNWYVGVRITRVSCRKKFGFQSSRWGSQCRQISLKISFVHISRTPSQKLLDRLKKHYFLTKCTRMPIHWQCNSGHTTDGILLHLMTNHVILRIQLTMYKYWCVFCICLCFAYVDVCFQSDKKNGFVNVGELEGCVHFKIGMCHTLCSYKLVIFVVIFNTTMTKRLWMIHELFIIIHEWTFMKLFYELHEEIVHECLDIHESHVLWIHSCICRSI